MTTVTTPPTVQEEETDEVKSTRKDVIFVVSWTALSTLIITVMLHYIEDWAWWVALLVWGVPAALIAYGLLTCEMGEPEPVERKIDSYSQNELRAMSMLASRRAEELAGWGRFKEAEAQNSLGLTYATLSTGAKAELGSEAAGNA